MLFTITASLNLNNDILISFSKLQLPIQVFFYVKPVLVISIRCVFIIWMLRQIIFVWQEGTNSSKLKDTLTSIEYRQFIYGHQIITELLIIQSSLKSKKGLPPQVIALPVTSILKFILYLACLIAACPDFIIAVISVFHWPIHSRMPTYPVELVPAWA